MKPYKIIALLLAAIFASLIISEIGAPPAAAQGGFSDNFTTDASLNTGLWATNTPFLSSLAGITGNACCPSYVTPQLTFSGAGMQMSGVTGDLQFTGVQSVQTLTPPLTVQTEVMGTLAAGNPFVLEVANGSLSQYVALFGHLGGAGANNISLSESTSYPYSGASGLNLYASPSISTEYVLNLAVDATGDASASVSDTIGNVLGSASNLSLGTGPFYVVLGQFEGEPPAPGSNTAVWNYANVTGGPPRPSVTGLSPSSGFVTGGTPVTISGSGFTGATQVLFGSNPAASLSVNSAASITAVSPPGSGTVDVTVVTPSGTSASTAADRFSYTDFTISLTTEPVAMTGSGQVVVQVVPLNGFSAPVTVTFSASPTGVTGLPTYDVLATQNAAAVTTGYTVFATAAAHPGTYALTVHGTATPGVGNALSDYSTAALTITRLIGVQNSVTVNSGATVTNLQTCPLGIRATSFISPPNPSFECFSIQENFDVDNASGGFTYWAQNVIVVEETLFGYQAEEDYNVFDSSGTLVACNGIPIARLSYCLRVPVFRSMTLPHTFTLTSLLTANGVTFSSELGSFAVPLPSVVSGSFIELRGLPYEPQADAGTVGPPELAIVGPQSKQTADFGFSTGGTVSSFVQLASQPSQWQSAGWGQVVASGQTETGEKSLNLAWSPSGGLYDGNTASFAYSSVSTDAGIHFGPCQIMASFFGCPN